MSAFITNPNQRLINIGTIENGRKEPCNISNIYARVNKEAMFNAMKELTPTNFLVWLYLASQKEGVTLAFSPTYVSEETGIKKASIQEGIRVLIRNNYLVQRGEHSNIYDFYEKPRDNTKESEVEIYIHKLGF